MGRAGRAEHPRAPCSVRPLTGGAVARQVDQVTLHLTGHREPLELVRKGASAQEIAGLRAAQAVRRQAMAIPELVPQTGPRSSTGATAVSTRQRST
jgi:hypothetical protein